MIRIREWVSEWSKPLPYEGDTDHEVTTPEDDPLIAGLVLLTYALAGLWMLAVGFV